MNRLTTEQRVRIVRGLTEGCSVRATARMADVSLNTVLKFIVDFGAACQRFHDERVRNLKAVERVQADEVWCFVGSKEKNVPEGKEDSEDYGSVWTWSAICSDTKLQIAWHVGTRDEECARHFMLDLASRCKNRIQLTTDGHWAYRSAVPAVFGKAIDYAVLVKHYAETRTDDARYSPCVCTGTSKTAVIGRPVAEDVSTSHVERSNLTLRMGNRRFTRLTNAFSRKTDNLRASVAIHYTFYNWCRVHKTLRVTPAMEAGLTDHVWELEELVGILEERETALYGSVWNKRGPYKKRERATSK